MTPVRPRHFCVAGVAETHPRSFHVAQPHIYCRFAWQAWYTWHRVARLDLVYFYFFLECGRCRAEAPSLHESKHGMQRQGQKVLGNVKSIEATKTKTTTKPKATTRKSPSQTCVSPAETAKQTAETKHNHTTGPEPKQKHLPTCWDLV